MTIILPAKTVITLHPLITIIIVTIAKNLKKKIVMSVLQNSVYYCLPSVIRLLF